MKKTIILGLVLGISLSVVADQTSVNAILNADVNTKAGRQIILNTEVSNSDPILAEILNKKFDSLRKEVSEASQIGDIKASMLTEAEFLNNYGNNWVLSKGQSVVDSKYHQLTGRSSVPDLRGVFLRGKIMVRQLIPQEN